MNGIKWDGYDRLVKIIFLLGDAPDLPHTYVTIPGFDCILGLTGWLIRRCWMILLVVFQFKLTFLFFISFFFFFIFFLLTFTELWLTFSLLLLANLHFEAAHCVPEAHCDQASRHAWTPCVCAICIPWPETPQQRRPRCRGVQRDHWNVHLWDSEAQ